MRVHWFRGRLRALINEKVLKGDAETQTGLLTLANFDFNLYAFKKFSNCFYSYIRFGV